MKLRNKHTGEIVEYDSIGFRKGLSDGWEDFIAKAKSLAELNETWEDYKPVEPLIKDPKIRKAVRAWAEVNEIDECICKEEMHCIAFETERGMFISFENANPIPPEGNYTIAELCGDEE